MCDLTPDVPLTRTGRITSLRFWKALAVDEPSLSSADKPLSMIA